MSHEPSSSASVDAPQVVKLDGFDDFARMAMPGADIERFRGCFEIALDINGAVPLSQVGFHFELSDADAPDQSSTEQTRDILNTFEPVAVYVGSVVLQERLLRELSRQSIVIPYYEDGGFAVVASVPTVLNASPSPAHEVSPPQYLAAAWLVHGPRATRLLFRRDEVESVIATLSDVHGDEPSDYTCTELCVHATASGVLDALAPSLQARSMAQPGVAMGVSPAHSVLLSLRHDGAIEAALRSLGMDARSTLERLACDAAQLALARALDIAPRVRACGASQASHTLAPCPFCGHQPREDNLMDSVYPLDRTTTLWRAGCVDTEGGCGASVLGTSREEVIARWNARAPLA